MNLRFSSRSARAYCAARVLLPSLAGAMACAVLATLLSGCSDRAVATMSSTAPPAPLKRFLSLSEKPSPEMLIARVLSDFMPSAIAGGLPARVERARGEVPNMARPLRYSVSEPLTIGSDGRIRDGAIEVIDDDFYSGDGYFVFTFRPDGDIDVQGVSGDLPDIEWLGVERLLDAVLPGLAAVIVAPGDATRKTAVARLLRTGARHRRDAPVPVGGLLPGVADPQRHRLLVRPGNDLDR